MTGFDDRLPPVLTAPFTRIGDWRGSLTKVLADGGFTAAGFGIAPRQILHSATAQPWVLRGLHAQQRPFSEAKIIVSLGGRMFWVVVDLRAGSRSFGRWQGFELAPDGAAGPAGLQVPAGFAHGCLSLSEGVEVMIVADQDFMPDHGLGIAWNDPDLSIDWPLAGRAPLLSDEHRAFGSFADFLSRCGSL